MSGATQDAAGGVTAARPRRRARAALSVAALAFGPLMMAGCGNDVGEQADSDPTTTEPTETTEQAPDSTVATPDSVPGDTSDGSEYPPGDPASGVAEYGTNPEWDRAADACEAGRMVGCDALTTPEADQTFAPEGTEMNTYGQTCGGRVPPKLDNFCQQLTFNPGQD